MLTSWPFCPRCGTILSAPNEKAEDTVNCDFCSFDCKFTDFNITPVVLYAFSVQCFPAILITIALQVTTSMPRQRPAWLDESTNSQSKEETQSNINL